MKPYSFDGAYSGCYSVRPMAMDERHIFIIHEILKAWPFTSALELGSFRGASSTAFVEAINDGASMHATFCDVNLTDELRAVIDHCKHQEQIHLARMPSWSLLRTLKHYDFILVDACHDMASVRKEMDELLLKLPLCVMAHDTNATASGYPAAEGAEMLKREFMKTPGYCCVEDCRVRAGEETQRGLFFATTDPDLYRVGLTAFEKWRNT